MVLIIIDFFTWVSEEVEHGLPKTGFGHTSYFCDSLGGMDCSYMNEKKNNLVEYL